MSQIPVSAKFVTLWNEFGETLMGEISSGAITGKADAPKAEVFRYVLSLETSHATLLSSLEALLGAQITTVSNRGEVECLCCAQTGWRNSLVHDAAMPCGRAAAAIAEAKGEK